MTLHRQARYVAGKTCNHLAKGGNRPIPELTIELSRIGKNFNQIVRAVYLHPQSLEASELARIADDLDAIKDLITELKENTIHADH